MRNKSVVIGETYLARVSGHTVPVTIKAERPYGGWYAKNHKTGRTIHVKTGRRLSKVEIQYQTPMGTFLTYEMASDALEAVDLDPRTCITVRRIGEPVKEEPVLEEVKTRLTITSTKEKKPMHMIKREMLKENLEQAAARLKEIADAVVNDDLAVEVVADQVDDVSAAVRRLEGAVIANGMQ